MKKVILVFVMLLLLTGCGKDAVKEDVDKNNTNNQTEVNENTDNRTPQAEIEIPKSN